MPVAEPAPTGLLGPRSNQFYRDMADADAALQSDEGSWARYIAEREAWLNPDLTQA